MTRTVLAVALAALALIGGRPAHAALVTVDPDAFASGTDISNSFAGITLSASGPFVAGPAVFALASAATSTGSNSFAYDDTFLGLYSQWAELAASLRVDFATPTDFVSIDIVANDSSDQGVLRAFNASDVLLATYTTGSVSMPGFEIASISRGTADIAYIIATGTGTQTVDLDRLVYNAVGVPNPSALLLVGGGIAGLGAARAWRRR